MAITLVNTPGAANANTYCDLTEATAYHQSRLWNDEWTGASVDQQTAALLWATKLLDLQQWKGSKTFQNGSLRWPQGGHVDRDRFAINSQAIPGFLRDATAEWALYLIKEDRTQDEGGLVSVGGKVGPLEDPSYYQRKTMPDSVKDILEPYLGCNTSSNHRIGRA